MKLQKPLFSCSNKYCQEDRSYYADQLFWYDKEERWLCEFCLENFPEGSEGIRLDKYLIQLNPSIKELLELK